MDLWDRRNGKRVLGGVGWGDIMVGMFCKKEDKKTKEKYFWIEDVKYLSDIRLFNLILFKRYPFTDVYHSLYNLMMMRRNRMTYTVDVA